MLIFILVPTAMHDLMKAGRFAGCQVRFAGAVRCVGGKNMGRIFVAAKVEVKLVSAWAWMDQARKAFIQAA
jgi:hypothetical protein